MNRVTLSKASGKLFWASLLGYSLAFGGFYFTTQHTLNRINFEEQQGAFLGFKDVICANGKLCNDAKFENVLMFDKKHYVTFTDIKASNPVNQEQLQRNYTDFINALPWYVKLQFDSVLEIRSINGKQLKVN